MSRESERCRLMKQNFMRLHQEGLTIPQIAEKYNMSFQQVYKTLGDIALENNVPREDLLQVIRTPSEITYKREQRFVKVKEEEIKKGFSEVEEKLTEIISIIDEILENDKEREL